MATPSSRPDNCVEAFYYFEKIVEERSQGRIQVDVKDGGQLGAHRDYIEQIQMGSIQAAEINVAVLTSLDPAFGVFSLPYAVKGADGLQKALDTGMNQKYNDILAKNGLTSIGWMIRSPRDMYISSHPVMTADDFKGMKVRIMEDPITRQAFELLGAVPVPLSANERYMALQTRVVDAAENSLSVILSQKEYEVTQYVSMTEHLISPNLIAFDPKFLAKLPADLRDIVLKAGDETGRYLTKLDLSNTEEEIKQLEGFGMVVNRVPDKSSFVEKLTPLYTSKRAEIGAEFVDAFTK
jgi:tripartite ATP-independent transporter DctP family solute receptor